MTYFAKNIVEAAEKLAAMVRDSGGKPVSLNLKQLYKSVEVLENPARLEETPTLEDFADSLEDAFCLVSTWNIAPCILVDVGSVPGLPRKNSHLVFQFPQAKDCTVLTL